MFVSAIVPAAGLGLRLNRSLPKPLIKLNKKPILVHTISILSRHPEIKEIIVVISKCSMDLVKEYFKRYRVKKIKKLVIGGASRRHSVQKGLKFVSDKADLVLIHDAVRPFIDLNMISRVIKKAKESRAAVLGVPVKSTVKEINEKLGVIRTLNRHCLYEIQTPQVFQKDLILNAYKSSPRMEAFDDASMVERLGKKVTVVFGSYFNIKITTPEDLLFADSILKFKGTSFKPIGGHPVS